MTGGHAVQIEVEYPREGVALITIQGQLDVYTAPQLRQTLADLLNRDVSTVILDVSPVEYVDSTALGVLIGAVRRVSERSGSLKLVCNNERIRRIFQITGLAKIFEIYTTVPDALATITSE
jgi:anti-sigma B factor antagonist